MTRAPRLLLGLLVAALSCAAAPPLPPHVLIVTLDTTRVDHLSVYGYGRETSPNLARFAERATRFTRAWSTSAWTLPAHASLFTGLHPEAHGAQFDIDGEGLGPNIRARTLDASFETLAERLAARGYETAAFVGGPWMQRRFGALQGFETIDDEVPTRAGRRGRELTDAARAWLESAPADRPLLLFVNYFDPHYPYDPPPGFDRWSEGAPGAPPTGWLPKALGGRPPSAALRRLLIARYDGEILAMDHEVGRLLGAWQRRVGDGHSLVIVTSDHGESFGEGGFFLHNGSLGEEAVRVPLLIAFPDGRGAGHVDESTVSLVDLFGLVAREVGLDAQPAAAPGSRRAFLALRRNPYRARRFGARYDRDLSAVIEWPYKLVVAEPGGPSLWRIDGRVERRVEAEVPRDALLAAWSEHRRGLGPAPDPERVELDAETRESLRALGYLD